ncbi:MAG: NAD-dependent protein deacylase [Turicibacter sp.]|nr:NAD-dependent protein deacylase [Turicibacter sp.]
MTFGAENDINRLIEFINLHNNIVFFGGAGVSTESGVPDFRSETGLYKAKEVYGHSPETLLSHTMFKQNPELFFKYYKENLIVPNIKPNNAHIALAQLERDGKLKAVITQNIDGLHTEAGSQTVFELHGSNLRHYCVSCEKRYDLAYTLEQDIPKCDKCGNIVRPDIVLYEEQLDTNIVREATRAIQNADMLIVGGTSLTVYPAAGLLRYFKGSKIVLINKSTTHLRADLVIDHPIGEVLGRCVL